MIYALRAATTRQAFGCPEGGPLAGCLQLLAMNFHFFHNLILDSNLSGK
jgi:hypothetical protein